MNAVENLRDTITPKSDQLNADDLTGTTMVITVSDVRRGTADQPVIIDYYGANGRPYKPCKSMRRVLIYAWGDDGKSWIGKSMQLYNDPEVKFGGVRVGGIRISHLSHIEGSQIMQLTATRGKRSPYRVDPLVTDAPYPEDLFNDRFPAWEAKIAEGKIDAETVIEKCRASGVLSDSQIKKIRMCGAASGPAVSQQEDGG